MINKIFPWWSKIALKIVMSRIPVGYRLWRYFGLFKHGNMESSSYNIRIFNQHVLNADLNEKLHGKVVLELGPGDSIATAILALCFDAKALLIDVGNFAIDDIYFYKKMIGDFRKKGLVFPHDLNSIKTINDLLLACDARYLTNGLKSYKEVETDSVDLIFSQAVLEHIREEDFIDTMRECHRILKKNGISSHQVDLKDHLSDSLNNLRFSKNTWESNLFANSGFYTNRIRFCKMIDIFKALYGGVIVSKEYRWNALPLDRNLLDLEYVNLSDQDLLVSAFDVILTK